MVDVLIESGNVCLDDVLRSGIAQPAQACTLWKRSPDWATDKVSVIIRGPLRFRYVAQYIGCECSIRNTLRDSDYWNRANPLTGLFRAYDHTRVVVCSSLQA